jgi:hypothetical protein
MSEEEIRKYIGELFRIVNMTSILVIDRKGTLHRLNCPFMVVAIVDVPPEITEGKRYRVEAVKMSLDIIDVFIIDRKGYHYWGFMILME